LPSFFVAGAIAMFGMAQSIQEKLKATLLYVFVLVYGFLPFYVISILLAARYNAFMVNMVLFFFILIWVNDTFAYVWGRLLGKHPFAPLVSPKKTWEGFIGGVVSTAVFALFVCPLFLPNLLSLGKTFLILSAIVVSIVGTVGDLFESSLKRWVGVKDSGNIIPGHGGLLDRFDGVLFAVWTYLGVMLFYLN
jgi:phosphatidate cytidylyltransferase